MILYFSQFAGCTELTEKTLKQNFSYHYIISSEKMDSGDEELVLNKKYKVIKKIGSGSFGYIYKCTPFHHLGESIQKK